MSQFQLGKFEENEREVISRRHTAHTYSTLIASIKELRRLRDLDSGEKLEPRDKIRATGGRVGLGVPKVSNLRFIIHYSELLTCDKTSKPWQPLSLTAQLWWLICPFLLCDLNKTSKSNCVLCSIVFWPNAPIYHFFSLPMKRRKSSRSETRAWNTRINWLRNSLPYRRCPWPEQKLLTDMYFHSPCCSLCFRKQEVLLSFVDNANMSSEIPKILVQLRR